MGEDEPVRAGTEWCASRPGVRAHRDDGAWDREFPFRCAEEGRARGWAMGRSRLGAGGSGDVDRVVLEWVQAGWG